MAQSFFFYDLETTSTNPRTGRIMQFAGQRTDLDMKPIGEPVNILIKLTPDVVPEPDAILVTGITPQQTIQDGITEAEFLKRFYSEIVTDDTVFVGYNSVRFDDEFMRYTLYRNFYDPYEWQWKNGCSRWDLLDVVRMTRALRPDGITWPVDAEGKPTNRLELITAQNGLDHENAHDALSDVYACIDLAKLLKSKQPKLFEYLYDMRNKKKVSELAESDQPFVYSSGKYPNEHHKTTVVMSIGAHPKRQGCLVYDLRHDPAQFKDMSAEHLADLWQYTKDPEALRLPVKTLRANCCPAVAPLGVLDDASQKRLKLDMETIRSHAKTLQCMSDWPAKVLQALKILDERQAAGRQSGETDVDAQLYDGFIGDQDKGLQATFRAADPNAIASMAEKFRDKRLQVLAPLYKARNYPENLTPEESEAWEQHRSKALLAGGQASRLARFFGRLGELAEQDGLTDEKRYLLEELQIYGQSIMPAADELGM